MLRSSARALLLLALLHAPVARAAPRDLFHQHYDRGVAAYKARDYARAITAFQAAYELRQLPRLLFNLAQAERQQGDAAAAADRHAVQRHDPAPGAGGQGDLAAAQHARGLVEVQRRRGRERGAGRGAEGDPREGLELSKSQRS